MLNGYKSKPFSTCNQNDCVYKFIVEKDYNSFWNSKYHHNNGIKFIENGYNQFNNNNLIQDLLQQMFEFDPIKRIKAKDIEHHAWFADMNAHKNLLEAHRYTSQLQHLCFLNDSTKTKEKNIQQSIDSIGSFYSKESRNKSNNNILKIGYDSTQPSNESSVEMSTLSEMMKQLENK